MDEKILVTGATGFVGSALIKRLLLCRNYQVAAMVRRPEVELPPEVTILVVPDKASISDQLFCNVSVVVHCAARAHIMNDRSADPLAEYREVNVNLTLDLARRAAAADVKRFVYISSIKVNGEESSPGCPFKADDIPAPMDPYGRSKMEAEQGLMNISKELGIEVVIIRPVLVYGPGVKANFQSMMRWLKYGVPLPLGAIRNKRSLVSINNLVDLIRVCLVHPGAANQIFVVSDGEDVSTSELLTRIGKALRTPARLVPVPPYLLNLVAGLIGRKDLARRLSSSLQVDIGKTRTLLGWNPIESLDEGLEIAADDFK